MYKLSHFNLVSNIGNKVYLANTAKGSSVVISNTEYSIIEKIISHLKTNQTLPEKFAPVIAFLEKNGFIVKQAINEIQSFINTYTDNKKTSNNHISVTISPTLKCNMNCFYCYENAHKNELLLDAETSNKIVSYVKSRTPKNGSLNITWFGGEPLLSIDQISTLSKQFITFCKEKSTKYSAQMVSNGFLLSRKIALALQSHKVSNIQITLDGPRKLHNKIRRNKENRKTADSFDRIIENIVENSDILKFSVRINATKQNISFIPQLIDQLDNLNVPKSTLVYLYPVFPSKQEKTSRFAFTKEEYGSKEAELTKYIFEKGFRIQNSFKRKSLVCTAVNENSFMIDAKGDLLKCEHDFGDPKASYANISSPNISDVENYDKWINYSPFNYPECLDCKLLPICLSSCPHNRLNEIPNDKHCISLKYNWKKMLPFYLENKHKRSV